jgi:outer membrane protein assembly factor BamB
MKRWAWTTLLLALPTGLVGGQVRDEFDIDYDAHRVVKRDAAGKVLWSTKLDGYLGLVRPPHLLWDAEWVYVANNGGVTALDAKTGKLVWHAKGPSDRLLLSGNLLLATDCTSPGYVTEAGRWLVARARSTGKEVFTTRLPRGLDALPIEEVAGLFLVQTWDEPGGQGNALLIDRNGKVRYRLDRQVVAGVRRGGDFVLLTSRDVVRLSPGGKTRWAVPLDREWSAGGDLVELAGGDVVAFLFDCNSDSGVRLARLDPATGKVVWRSCCDCLGVTHSEYEHEATAAVEGGKLRVRSRGSAGHFTELLDLQSGRQLRRMQHIDKDYEEP